MERADYEDRKRPEFFNTLAMLYLKARGEDATKQFLKYYQKAKEAEQLLLPCFLPYENNRKTIAELIFNMREVSANSSH